MDTPLPQFEVDRLTYPAMLPAEIAVFRAWLRLHEGEYTAFDYNVRVGPGYDPGEGVMQAIRVMSIKSTQKRMDALAWQGDTPLIIEVKDRAGLSAIGQILGYKVHWQKENPQSIPPKILLVANRLAPGVEDVLRAHNVPWELVEV